MANYLKTKAIVLRRTNFAEYDRIIQFLTPNGQISALAKGVRKPKSKLAGGLELFSISNLVLIKGRTDLYRLTSARLEHYFENIIKDYDRMELAYQIIKDVSAQSRDIDDASWFEILNQVFYGLDKGLDLRLIKIWYYFQSSEIMGEGINLSYDINGKKLDANQKYNYNFSERSFEPSSLGQFHKNHIKLMRLMIEHSLLIVNQVKESERYLEQIEQILKTI